MVNNYSLQLHVMILSFCFSWEGFTIIFNINKPKTKEKNECLPAQLMDPILVLNFVLSLNFII